jgi:hypothetical protein
MVELLTPIDPVAFVLKRLSREAKKWNSGTSLAARNHLACALNNNGGDA